MTERSGRIFLGLGGALAGGAVSLALAGAYETGKQQDLAEASVAEVHANIADMLEEDGLEMFKPKNLKVDTEYYAVNGNPISREHPIREGWVDLKVGSCTLKQINIIFESYADPSVNAPEGAAFDPSVDGIIAYESATKDESFTNYYSFSKRAVELDKSLAGQQPTAEDYCEAMKQAY